MFQYNRKRNLSVKYVFIALFIFLVLINVGYSFSEEKLLLNKPDNSYKFQTSVELGFLDVLRHRIQFDSNGTEFDYVTEGGQEVLFPFSRITGEFNFSKKHTLIFLIQPLDVRTEAILKRDIIVSGQAFPENTYMKLRYGFTFYRLSYLYDFLKADNEELAIGLSFQLRNASISFASADGELFTINENVGPVPIFKFRGRLPFDNGMWLGTELDGFYASGKYITGSRNDFVGAILDASVRLGFQLTGYLDSFVNVRYIGGGAEGTEKDYPGPGDGYTNNWLHTLSISLGFYLR